MRRQYFVTGLALAISLGLLASTAHGGANPKIPAYGYGTIVPSPNPAVVSENTHITVAVENDGDATATNVMVKLSFNDWGVTFQGWQEIGTVALSSLTAGGTGMTAYDKTFTNRAHTCLEALIVGASENTNLDDDRGQINLEVVNAGEDFSYDVPVRNEGAAPIIVDVAGNCDTGGRPIPCHAEAQDNVAIAPGIEMRVPVEVEFAPGTPRGTEVVIDVEGALDGAAPGDANARNHVRMVVRHETAKGLKQDIVANLQALIGTLGSPKAEKDLAKAIKSIQASIESSSWISDFSVAKAGGGSGVFSKEAKAVKSLEKLSIALDIAGLAPERVVVEAARAALVDADRILAQSAISEASGDAAAEAELELGDKAREAGDALGAIAHYKLAWKLARS